MRHWTNALVAAVTGIVAATGASAQQHVLNMLVLSEDAPKIQKIADAYQAKHPDVAIKMQSAPWDQYFQTAELRLNSKDKSVDLVYVGLNVILTSVETALRNIESSQAAAPPKVRSA